MSFWKTAVLAVLVGLLGAYVYWVERPALEAESSGTTLLVFDPGDITRLQLESPAQTIAAERIDGGWRLLAPIEAPADAGAIDTLLRAAAEADEKRLIDPTPEDPGRFGLDVPTVVLRLETEAGGLPALHVGASTPIGFQAYARRGDEPAVYLTGGALRAALQKEADDLRDRKILADLPDDVDEIILEGRNRETVALERRDSGWHLTAPIETPADGAAVRNLLSAVRGLRAVAFDAEAGPDVETQRGLAPASFRLRLSAGGQSTGLRLGTPAPEEGRELQPLAVDDRAQIYLIAPSATASLDRSADDLRDKTVLAVDPDAVAHVRVRRSDGDRFALVLGKDGWRLRDETGAGLDPLIAQRFVDDLLTLRGEEVLDADGGLPGLASGSAPASAIEIEFFDRQDSLLGALVADVSTRADGTMIHRAAARGAGPVYQIPDYVFGRIDKGRGGFDDETTTPVTN